MDLQTILAHPKVAAVRFPGDQDLATVFIKAFNDGGIEFPIDFDDAWKFVAYSNKANGLRKLKKGGFKEGVDYTVTRDTGNVVIQVDENSPSSDEILDQGGRPAEKYYMTVQAFESFAMVAQTETGDKVREFFRAIREQPTSS